MANAPAARRRTRTRAPGVYRSISGKYEIAYRDSDGKQRFTVVGDNFEEAKAERAAIVKRLHDGERIRSTRQTFGEWAEEWIAHVDKRPRTIEAYRYALDKHLLPRFRNKQLSSITVDDVAHLVSEMRRKGYSGSTIQGALTPLRSSLARAKRRGMLGANPVLELDAGERPKLGKRTKRVLDEEEIASLVANAGSFRAIIATLIFSGLRLGELLGLQWRDVDFDGEFIQVRRQLGRGRETSDLKTDSGARDVILVSQLGTVLKRHRIASRYKAPTDFVFPAPDGRGRDHRSVSRGIERALSRAGLAGEKVSAHSMRHTFASLLIVGLKMDPVNVAAQLGHSNPATTMRVYAHLFAKARHADETREALAKTYGHLLAGA